MARYSVLEGYLGDYGADEFVDQEYMRTPADQQLVANLQLYAGSGNMVGQPSSVAIDTPASAGVPTWAWIAGAGLLAVLLFGKR